MGINAELEPLNKLNTCYNYMRRSTIAVCVAMLVALIVGSIILRQKHGHGSSVGSGTLRVLPFAFAGSGGMVLIVLCVLKCYVAVSAKKYLCNIQRVCTQNSDDNSKLSFKVPEDFIVTGDAARQKG